MAKQLVSPVERHIEKVVVGAAGLILLGVIGMFLVVSPNKVELKGEQIGPAQIDQKAAEIARQTVSRLRAAQPQEEELPLLHPEFEEAIRSFPPSDTALASAVPIGPEVPVVDTKPVADEDRTLVEVASPGAPQVTFGRSRVEVSQMGSLADRYQQTNWVTVSATFNVKEQMERLRRNYGARFQNVVFGPVELERRAQRNDGTWSDDDWAEVDTWPAASLPRAPAITFKLEEGVLVTNRETRADVAKFLDQLNAPAQQLEQIRPTMAPVLQGDDWRFPILTSYRDVQLQDHEFQFPNEPPENLEDRYGILGAADNRTIMPEEKGPRELLDEANKLFERARASCDEADATRAHNKAFDARDHKDAGARDKREAENIMQRVNGLKADIQRGICRPRGVSGDRPGPAREKLPMQQVWAHDARPGSVESGKTYQYRLRVSIFNRLAAEPTMFKDAENAKVIYLHSEWSEPTQPISISPDTWVFVTSDDERREQVTIEIFRWFEGVWVKNRDKFGIGQRLVTQNRHEVPALDGDGVDNPTITYDANMTVVDIDHRRSYRPRKRGRGSGFDPPEQAASVVLIDGNGRLHERIVPNDKSHPSKSTLGSLEFQYRPPR